MVDQSVLETKVDQLNRDILLLRRGVAHLIGKLPEAPMQEPKDWREPLVDRGARPADMDELTWTVQRALRLTQGAVLDIEQAKLRIDSLARGAGRTLWSVD